MVPRGIISAPQQSGFLEAPWNCSCSAPFWSQGSTCYFNAFALPGGHVAIGKGLVDALSTEDELAAILGHEVAHVDRYHCADVIHIESARRRVPLGALLTLPIELFRAGYSKDQEIEADRAGTVLAVEAGYSPLGAIHAMQILAARMPRGGVRPGNPLEETARAGLGGLGEYFKSHPDPDVRLRVIEDLMRAQGWMSAPERPLLADGQKRAGA